jgi:glycosyltransferase involved in cell wall biosynthesis
LKRSLQVDQIVREWAPGCGGVERAAHTLADFLQQEGASVVIHSLHPPKVVDTLTVIYERKRLASLQIGRLSIPLPTRHLLGLACGSNPMVVHLPCPGVLLIVFLAKLCRRKRIIYVYWHAFLAQRANGFGFWEQIYQQVSITFLRASSLRILVGSPPLLDSLEAAGIPSARIDILPYCLTDSQETSLSHVFQERCQTKSERHHDPMLKLIFIGRLDSYKRIDRILLLIKNGLNASMSIVGRGENFEQLLALAGKNSIDASISFTGFASEETKYACLARSNLLVLPSETCNEAFGIVQIEALAAGVPTLSLDADRSGMGWVSSNRDLGFEKLSNIHSYEVALKKLANDRSPIYRCEDIARKKYVENFSRQKWKLTALDIFGNLISNDQEESS